MFQRPSAMGFRSHASDDPSDEFFLSLPRQGSGIVGGFISIAAVRGRVSGISTIGTANFFSIGENPWTSNVLGCSPKDMSTTFDVYYPRMIVSRQCDCLVDELQFSWLDSLGSFCFIPLLCSPLGLDAHRIRIHCPIGQSENNDGGIKTYMPRYLARNARPMDGIVRRRFMVDHCPTHRPATVDNNPPR
jgi:hypothetical protein